MVLVKLLSGDLIEVDGSTPLIVIENIRHLLENKNGSAVLIDSTTGEKAETITPDKIYYILFDTGTLLSWIPKDKLNWGILSSNTKAIPYLLDFKEQIDLSLLACNPCPEAMRMLEELLPIENVRAFFSVDKRICGNPFLFELSEEFRRELNLTRLDLLCNPNPDILSKVIEEKPIHPSEWMYLSTNATEYATDLLLKSIYDSTGDITSYLKRLEWQGLSSNPYALRLLLDPTYKKYVDWGQVASIPVKEAIDAAVFGMEFQDRDIWFGLLSNHSEYAMTVAERYPYMINPITNPYAMRFIKKNFALYKQLNWEGLCQNTNPEVLDLLKDHYQKIQWTLFSENPISIDMIKEKYENGEYIHFDHFSKNPAIFQ